MKLKEITAALERLAPLRLQEEKDNSGLQVGFPDADVSRVLVCLDITEAVIQEAAAKDCQLVVSHHPLIYRPLSQVSDTTYQQRCVVAALSSGIALYSAHTCLDKAPGGVNHKMAEVIGLQNLRVLCPEADGNSGFGLVGELPAPEKDTDFLARVKEAFRVKNLRHSAPDGRLVRRVAVCGGSGNSFLPEAIRAGVDCYVTGEFRYHDYFDNAGVLLAELGHYQSEQFTKDLLAGYLQDACPSLEVLLTALDTNPIQYD